MKPVLSLTIDQLIRGTSCTERPLFEEELEPTLISLPTWASLFHGFQTPSFPEVNCTLADTIELNEASPFLSSGIYSCKDEDSSRTGTSSIPTPPRLKNLLRERICIDAWVQNCSRDAPEHTPWQYSESVESDAYPPWKAEGSLIPPLPFKKTLFEIHRLNVPEPDNENEPPQIPLPLAPHREPPCTRLSSSSRSSRSKRQSVTLERTHLASPSSLKNHLHMRKESPPLAFSLAARRGKRPLSSLTLPNIAQSSTLVISQDLDSDDISCDACFPPGNRVHKRGEKQEAKPSVSARVFDDNLSYPDIPTAFRGTTSALPSPFDCEMQIDNETSLDLSTMIKNLQKHCEALALGTPIRMNAPMTSSSNEWQALVDDIINKTSTCNEDVSILASTPGGSRYSKTDQPELSMATGQCLGSSGHSPCCPSFLSTTSNTEHASRSSPSVGNTADPAKRKPRGILKSAKSVRFAAFSEEISPGSMSQSKRLLRHTTHVPSPLRNSFAPEEGDFTGSRGPHFDNTFLSPSTLSSRSIRKRFSFSNLASNASEVVTKKGKKSLTTPASRRISAPISRPESFISPRSAPTPKPSQSQQSKLARHRSLGPRDAMVRGSRHKKDVNSSTLVRRWSMMDENMVRRNEHSTPSSEKKLPLSVVARSRQKENSKIPALKSIFTRFK